MASYGYEAINAAGKQVKGSIEADSIEKARSDLKNQGMIVMELKEQSILTRDINIDIGGKPRFELEIGVFGGNHDFICDYAFGGGAGHG